MKSLRPFKGRELRPPARLGRAEPRAEVLQALPVVGGAGRIEGGEPRGERAGDEERAPRIGQEVRVAAGVEVALRPAHRRRWATSRTAHRARGGEAARAARLDVAVPRLVHERRQPADLEVEPDVHEQVRAAELHREHGVRVHEVRVLDAARQALHPHALSADLLRQGGEPLRRGHDLQRGGGAGGDGGGDEGSERDGLPDCECHEVIL